MFLARLLRSFPLAACVVAAVFLLPSAARSGAISLASVSTPVPPVAPVIMAAAKEWFHRFQTGDIDRSQLDDEVNGELTSTMIHQEATTLTAYGRPASFVFLRSDPVGEAVGYKFLLTFKSAKIVEAIAFDGDGKIAGIDFQIWLPPLS
jgi:hypothetical protein